MSSRASGGALAASLITAAIVGFAGGAYIGTQTGNASSGSESSADGGDDATAPQDDPSNGGNGGDEPTEEASDEVALSLELDDPAQAEVAPGDCVAMSGALNPPVAEVSVQLQRKLDGADWAAFPVSWSTKEDGSFGGSACSDREGTNSYRVVRVDDDSVASEPVEVTVG